MERGDLPYTVKGNGKDLVKMMENKTLIIVGIGFLLVGVIVILSMVISNLRKKVVAITAQAQLNVESARQKAASEIAAARSSFEKEKRAMNEQYNKNIDRIRYECEIQIQHVKEDIESDKRTLSAMNEKELLANIMIALNGYGSRFDRIEKHLTDDQLTERVNRLFGEVSAKINEFKRDLTEQIDEMNNSIESSLRDTDLINTMEEISSKIESISSSVFNIENEVSDISSIRSTVDDIQTSVSDKYSYDSLASNIDEVLSAVNEAKDAAESAKDAAESAKDAAESHF